MQNLLLYIYVTIRLNYKLNILTMMSSSLNKIKNIFSKKYKTIQGLNWIFALMTSLLGFFCGSIAFTWSSRFLDWNGLLGVLILFFSECIGWLTMSSPKRFQEPNSIFLHFIYIRRGLLFALLADGFKVGS